jgi:hypothetical protein
MSCAVPTKLLSFYSNKVNIYDSSCFIKLPDWKSCPAPSCIILAPQLVYPPAGPYVPPAVCPVPQPLNPPGAYCGNIIAPCNIPCYNGNAPVGTEVPCNSFCGQSQSVGCPPKPSVPYGCSSCK